MKKVIGGTTAFMGLDVSREAHLIEDGALTKSVNGWTDKEGAVSVARGRKFLYGGYDDISCFSAGRQDGEDVLVWMDGDNVYANGGKVGEISAGTTMYARDFDDKFFFMGSDDNKNYLYDGTNLRQHGAWQPETVTDQGIGIPKSGGSVYSSVSIASITSDDPGVVTTSTPHYLEDGESCYISGVTTMTEVNDRTFVITYIDATSFSIEDTSDYTAGTGGTCYVHGCGLDAGDYKWYMTTTLRLASGETLEGRPRGLRRYLDDVEQLDDHTTNWEARTFTIDPTYKVELQIYVDFATEYTISGTVGVDYWPGVRLYRTKADGSDFYLDTSWEYGDTDLTVSGGYYIVNTSVHKRDIDIGAVYLYGLYDNDSPPQSSLMALVGQRLLMNDVDNPDRLYFTGLNGTDYVPTLNYLLVPDDITAIGSIGSVGVIMSCDRMWRVSFLGGIPDMDEIKTSVGTTYGKVMATTDMGLLFLRKDGLWITNGASPAVKISRNGFSEINTPTSITAYGDVVYVADSNTAYVLIKRNGGSYWHEHSVYETISDATNGKFYAASATSVFELFAGDKISAVIRTKDWTNYDEVEAVRCVIDYEGDDVPEVWVNGNRQSDYDGHPDEGTDREGQRRLLRMSIPRLLGHLFNIEVTMSGNGKLFGSWLEVE